MSRQSRVEARLEPTMPCEHVRGLSSGVRMKLAYVRLVGAPNQPFKADAYCSEQPWLFVRVQHMREEKGNHIY